FCDRSENICENLDPVAAEIEHRSAAGSVLFHEPMARMVCLGIEVFEGVYLGQNRFSDFAGLNDFLRAFDNRIEMAIVGDTQRYLIRVTGSDHSIAFPWVHRQRLFAEHLL